MAFDGFIDEATDRRKRLTVYATDPISDVGEQFSFRNVAVDQRRLPSGGPEPYVTIHEGSLFRGALRYADLLTLLEPPVVRPGRRADVSEGYRTLFDLLDDTVFSTTDRRRLLGASREIEDRAFRVGHGMLRVSFQTLSAFRAQTDVYGHLAHETGLDIHVYGEADWNPPEIDGITYHGSPAESVRRFWVVAFDGGGNEMQACALVARERDGEYTGFWTYDPDTVERILDELAREG